MEVPVRGDITPRAWLPEEAGPGLPTVNWGGIVLFMSVFQA